MTGQSLQKGPKEVLPLLSSWTSHLPSAWTLASCVTSDCRRGLGTFAGGVGIRTILDRWSFNLDGLHSGIDIDCCKRGGSERSVRGGSI
jgi:hypothetical protein